MKYLCPLIFASLFHSALAQEINISNDTDASLNTYNFSRHENPFANTINQQTIELSEHNFTYQNYINQHIFFTSQEIVQPIDRHFPVTQIFTEWSLISRLSIPRYSEFGDISYLNTIDYCSGKPYEADTQLGFNDDETYPFNAYHKESICLMSEFITFRIIPTNAINIEAIKKNCKNLITDRHGVICLDVMQSTNMDDQPNKK